MLIKQLVYVLNKQDRIEEDACGSTIIKVFFLTLFLVINEAI